MLTGGPASKLENSTSGSSYKTIAACEKNGTTKTHADNVSDRLGHLFVTKL